MCDQEACAFLVEAENFSPGVTLLRITAAMNFLLLPVSQAAKTLAEKSKNAFTQI